jgi:hypothetical protein
MGAQVSAPGKAVAAAAADHVTFTAYCLSRAEINNVRADFHNLAHEFVPDHHRNRDGFPRPFIPFEDMDVGAANTGPPYADENVIYSESRDIDVFQPKAKFRLGFDKSLHNPRRTGHIHLKSFRVVERSGRSKEFAVPAKYSF